MRNSAVSATRFRIPPDGAEGSGLGLAIVKEIVEASDGSIALAAASPEGCGLLVEGNLPAADAP